MTSIDLQKIISFYDEKKPLNSPHASVLTGMCGEELIAGLIKHYFDSKGQQCKVHSQKPKDGKWLDRWIEVNGILYQTEIKNWCSHSLGGVAIPLTAPDQALIQHAQVRFNTQYDSVSQILIHPQVVKVLLPMNNPPVQNVHIHPLAAYWFPILPSSVSNQTPLLSIDPFFTLPCSDPNFKDIHFFSASIYCRQLLAQGIKHICLDMPLFEYRLLQIHQLFGQCYEDKMIQV